MTYILKLREWIWRIEPDDARDRCLLKYKTPAGWTPVNAFPFPEQAAWAVANSKTELREWDEQPQSHGKTISDLLVWDWDETGGLRLQS
jgi:hypothetical protein